MVAGADRADLAASDGIKMKLHFQHLRDTPNVGDRSCSPFDYFTWDNATASDIRKNDTPDYDVGIYGGGKIFGGLSGYDGVRRPRNGLNIAWGVSTVQSFPFSLRYMRGRKLMDLVGSRDYGDTRYDYAPCPSCMSPIFDQPPAPEHDVVFYAHHGKTGTMGLGIPDHIPVETNLCADLPTALRFIASGKTVVSNSYHGVYWALLMGRKTICVPFSNKFSHYRMAPHYATPANWLRSIEKAVAQPDMLGVVREATATFEAKVRALIADQQTTTAETLPA